MRQILNKILFPGIPILIILFLPNLNQIYWKYHEPEGFFYSGFHISDQNTYTAIFRSVIERGTGFTYSYPYSAPGKDNPAVFFQIPFMVLAWLWKLSGSLLAAWELFRYIFGILWIYTFYLVFREFFNIFYQGDYKHKNKRFVQNAMFLTLIFGGGLAWLIAIFNYFYINSYATTPSDYISYIDVFKSIESGYADWILNFFRNTFHPLEPNYHFFFFLSILGILRKNVLMTALGQLLTCLSSVFTGIEISAVLLTYIITRNRGILKQFILYLLIFATFIFYYKIFLPGYPVAKILVEQHLINLFNPIKPKLYFCAYGTLLLTVPVILLNRKFRKTISQLPEGRLLLVWLFVVVLLIQNDKFLPEGKALQPSHFTRGYLFTVLMMISCLGLYPVFVTIVTKSFRIGLSVIISLFFIFTADNLIFVMSNFSFEPHSYFLILPEDSRKTFNFLSTLKDEETVFSTDLRMGDQVPAFTHHSSIFGLAYATPDWGAKRDMGSYFVHNQYVDEFIEKYKVTMLIVPKLESLDIRNSVARKDWKIIYENSVWEVYALPKAKKK